MRVSEVSEQLLLAQMLWTRLFNDKALRESEKERMVQSLVFFLSSSPALKDPRESWREKKRRRTEEF